MKSWHWLALAVLTLLSVLGEFTMSHDPAHDYWWTHIPLFFILYGFLGCVLIIVASKALGKLFLQKKEDYYDAD